jgi:hypothetical protein
MDALDLSNAPPRRPRAELGGVIFLPRSIDKARATLPTGERNEYNVTGLTTRMLEKLGITPDDFIAAVAAAKSDDDVLAYVRGHATQAQIDEWNAFASAFQPRNGDRAEAQKIFTWLGERPDLTQALDILEEDDKRNYAAR